MSEQEPNSSKPEIEEWRKKLSLATIPFYGLQDKQFKPNGSGVLLQIADTHFVLTAAHHLEGPLRHQIPYYTAPVDLLAPPISLHDAIVTVSRNEVLDVAVLELAAEVVEQLLPVRNFLRLKDIDTRPAPIPGTYLVMGFPCAYTHTNEQTRIIQAEPLPFVTGIFTGEPLPGSYDPQAHILLEYSRECLDHHGKPSESPHPEGMSGCGIWRLAEDAKGDDIHSQKKCLVAIQHRYFGKRDYIKGTWAVHALCLIAEQYEELRPAMSIQLPKGFTC